MPSNSASSAPSASQPKPEENQIFTFDYGEGLTFNDLLSQVLVTGEDYDFSLSLLTSLIEHAYPLLIIDLQGKFRSQVRRLALALGRADDIIEFGTGGKAAPVNLLPGLNTPELATLLEWTMKTDFDESSEHTDFNIFGIRYAQDMARTLQYQGKHIQGEQPNLLQLSSLLSQPELAREHYKIWKKEFHDRGNKEEINFIKKIEKDPCHPLRSEENPNSEDSERIKLEQANFALTGVRTALKNFCDTPGIADNFCNSEGQEIELWRYFDEGKIVLVSFNPDADLAAVALIQIFISAWWAAISSRGVENARPSCVFIDNAQAVINLNDRRFSERRLLGMAPELIAALIMQTENLSTFMGSRNMQAVQSLVDHCGINIFFHSNDPLTKEIAASFGGYNLSSLEPGQALVIRNERKNAEYISDIETYNNAYAHCQELLDIGREIEK